MSQNRAEESGQCVSSYHEGDTRGENHEVSLRKLCKYTLVYREYAYCQHVYTTYVRMFMYSMYAGQLCSVGMIDYWCVCSSVDMSAC